MKQKIILGMFALVAAVGMLSLTKADAATVLTDEEIACVQAAVGARETALQEDVTTFQTTWNAALSTRATALQAAWALTTKKERRDAIKAAWTAYKTSFNTARKTFNTDVKADWKAFRVAVKACSLPSAVANDDSETAKSDYTLE